MLIKLKDLNKEKAKRKRKIVMIKKKKVIPKIHYPRSFLGKRSSEKLNNKEIVEVVMQLPLYLCLSIDSRLSTT